MRIRTVLLGLTMACSIPGKEPAPTSGGGKPAPTPPQSPTTAARVAEVPLPEFAASQQIATEQTPAPWSLTASDGSGLRVTRIDAKAVVQGPLAFTELHLYFQNTENRIREGTFAITLPPGAAVSRFAMENEGRFMEAEVVEKQLARRAYEDFLHRKQDPALLEKAAGNQFTARVFPIPANASKHLVISFSQELPGARYTLPLRGLPKVERVDVKLDVTSANGQRIEQVMKETNWTPTRDFVSTAPSSAEALAAGTIVAAQLPAMDASQQQFDAPKAITLLVDTSASRALGFDRYMSTVQELVKTLVARHGDNLVLELVAFDQDTQPIFTGRAKDLADLHLQLLRTRGAAGASDLGQALATLRAPRERVVVITDAVFTAGAKKPELVAQVGKLAANKVERLDIVLAGGIRDEQLASSLVTAGLPRAGAVLDLDQGISDVAAGLGERILVDVKVEVAGATWVYPSVIKSARASARTMVYARLAKPAQTIEVAIAGKKRLVGLAGGTPALVERAAATAEIAELENRLDSADGKQLAALRSDIANRSVAARVISSQTSLLVLESDGDYARYGIDRNALADILVIGPSGLEQTNRKLQIAEHKPNKPQPRKQLDPSQLTTTAMEGADKAKGAKDEEEKPADGAPSTGHAMGPGNAMDPGASAGSAAPRGDTVALAKEAKLEEASESPIEAPKVATAEPPPPPASSRPSGTPPPTMRPPAAPSPEPAALRQAEVTRDQAERRRAVRVDRDSVNNPFSSEDAYVGTGSSNDDQREAWPPRDAPAPLRGPLAEINRAIKNGNIASALTKARAWHAKDPGDVLALIGYGEALEASKDLAHASRIYGSIIDLFPGRADLRRFAGERLERIGANARSLAVDTYQRAVEERPDHMTGHRLLAYALLRHGKHAEAFTAILRGLDQQYPDNRFAGGERVLRDDAGLIGAAYAATDPTKKAFIKEQLAKRSLSLPTKPSTRFIMYWETDANDVDFHIQDARGGHAFYSNPQLTSGGELYADITTGYGPECFAIEGKPTAGPYRLSINYYSQGPMGYGMGLLQIVKHDGKGTLSFQDRPYVIMNDHAYVDLGTFK